MRINIVDCPIHSFKLEGPQIEKYHEDALIKARDMYLNMHDQAYRDLMFNDFNVLWTPDKKATNDIDPKDGFWAMYNFLFNVCLIKILGKKHNLEIIDKTSYEFRNQSHFFSFLEDENFKFKVNEEKYREKSFIGSVKILIKSTLLEINSYASDLILFLKREFQKPKNKEVETFKNGTNKKTILLAIPPVSDSYIKFYIKWRYSQILQVLKRFEEKGFRVYLVTSKNYQNHNDFEFPFINVNELVSRKERLFIFIKSILLKLRTLGYKQYKRIKAESAIEKYFLKNIPTELYYAIKDNRAYNNLFKMFGPGLYIMKGPTVYKGISIRNYNARKHGVRSLTVSGRIMTSTRLTNCFLDAYTDSNFPEVLPHAIIASNNISYDTIQKQTDQIGIYVNKMSPSPGKGKDLIHDPFSITLVLQKKNEMESMIDAVISAVEKEENLILNLKAHPDFKIKDRVRQKYKRVSFVNIFEDNVSLEDAVEMSDICISCYSTAVLKFISKGKPIVWLNNITLNSLLLSDFQKKVGLIANNVDELQQIIRKFVSNPEFYKSQKNEQLIQLQNFIDEQDGYRNDSFYSVIENELEKI